MNKEEALLKIFKYINSGYHELEIPKKLYSETLVQKLLENSKWTFNNLEYNYTTSTVDETDSDKAKNNLLVVGETEISKAVSKYVQTDDIPLDVLIAGDYLGFSLTETISSLDDYFSGSLKNVPVKILPRVIKTVASLPKGKVNYDGEMGLVKTISNYCKQKEERRCPLEVGVPPLYSIALSFYIDEDYERFLTWADNLYKDENCECYRIFNRIIEKYGISTGSLKVGINLYKQGDLINRYEEPVLIRFITTAITKGDEDSMKLIETKLGVKPDLIRQAGINYLSNQRNKND